MKKRMLNRLFTLSLSFITVFTSIPVSAKTVSENEVQTEEIAVEAIAESDEETDDILSDERYNSIWLPEDGHPGLDGFGLMPETSADADMLEAEGAGEGFVADSISNMRKNGIITSEKVASYGTKYDPRTLGLVTSVKNQGQWGLCWAFSANSTAESQLILKGYADSSIDLSEMYLAYAAYMTDWKNKNYSFTQSCNAGGSNNTSQLYFNIGYGPVLESRAPWQEPTDDYTLPDSVLNSADYECGYLYSSTITSAKEDIENLKYMIKNYGAAELGMYFYSGSTTHGFKTAGSKTADANYYWPGTGFGQQNHAVSVIGWDDDYPASSFLTTAPGNGAWLVKNSYGSGNTAVGSGYFWISYYDDTIDSDYMIPVLEKKGTYGTNIEVVSSTYDGKPLYVGDNFTFSVKTYPENNPIRSLVSSDENCLKIEEVSNKTYKVTVLGVPKNNTGYVSVGFGMGYGYQPVYSSNKIGATYYFTVNNTPVLSLTDDDSKAVSLKKGESKALTPSYSDGGSYAYTLASSDTSVVTVNGSTLKAVGYGTAQIEGSFSFKNAPTKKAVVTVVVQPDMTVDLDSRTVEASFDDYKAGKTFSKQLGITLNGQKVTDYSKFTFTTDGLVVRCTDTGFVTVDFPNETITGLSDASGNGYLTVTYKNGDFTATKTINITSVVKACTHTSQTKKIHQKAGFDTNGRYSMVCDVCGYTVGDNIRKIPYVNYPSVNSSYAYTGRQVTPAVTLTDENGKTIPSSIYTVTYGENVSETGSVTVTLSSSEYEDCYEMSFDIVQDSPVDPVDPVDPSDPVDPVTPSDPVGPSDPSDPTVPVSCSHVSGGRFVTTQKAGFGTFGTKQYVCAACGSALSTISIPSVLTPSVAFGMYAYTGSQVRPYVTVHTSDYTLLPADSYDVYYGTNITGTGTYSVVLKGDYAGTHSGSFTITGAPQVSGGDKTGDSSDGGSVKPAKVTVPKLTASAKKSAGKIKVSWKKKTGLSKVQIQVSSVKTFKAGKTKSYSASGRSVSKTVKPSGKTYSYVRVRGVKKVNGKTYYGKWSSVKKVKK